MPAESTHFNNNAASPLLELRNVACERDDELLFDPVSMVVRPCSIVQLEGPNGVGKTSLLRCIAGLSTRFRGELLWRGQALRGSSLNKARAEFAEQSCYLGHHAGIKAALSARENLLWWAALRGIDAHAHVDDALATVGLAGYEISPCYQLSAGQQRRVALARLFMAQTPLWILDEPFTAIDKQGVAQLESWLVAHAKNGGAVLLTTHQPLTSIDALIKVALSSVAQSSEISSIANAQTDGSADDY